ncbi:hypothetical protein AVEN_107839-1, partial [Araneus ventricosus]
HLKFSFPVSHSDPPRFEISNVGYVRRKQTANKRAARATDRAGKKHNHTQIYVRFIFQFEFRFYSNQVLAITIEKFDCSKKSGTFQESRYRDTSVNDSSHSGA